MDKRQKQLKAAVEISLHHGDLHPWYVAITAANWNNKSIDWEAFLLGLLHDAVEDGYATTPELDEAKIPDVVVRAVIIISRKDGEKYDDYITRIKSAQGDAGRLARRVKLADATVNLNRCIADPAFSSLEKRYRKVIEELS